MEFTPQRDLLWQKYEISEPKILRKFDWQISPAASAEIVIMPKITPNNPATTHSEGAKPSPQSPQAPAGLSDRATKVAAAAVGAGRWGMCGRHRRGVRIGGGGGPQSGRSTGAAVREAVRQPHIPRIRGQER